MAGNAIAERAAGGPAPAAPEPEDMLEQWAQEVGVPPGTAPEEAMQMIWAKMPTDHVAEVIDALSQKHGIIPPWAGQPGTEGKMRLGGPPPDMTVEPPPVSMGGEMAEPAREGVIPRQRIIPQDTRGWAPHPFEDTGDHYGGNAIRQRRRI